MLYDVQAYFLWKKTRTSTVCYHLPRSVKLSLQAVAEIAMFFLARTWSLLKDFATNEVHFGWEIWLI